MDIKKRATAITGLRRLLAYDEAIGKLHDAGVSEEFLMAIEKNRELMEAINEIAPNIGPGPVADWSCCITVGNPLRELGEEVINPAIREIK